MTTEPSPFVAALGWALLHFLWQGAAITIVLALALRLTQGAARRYVVSSCAMLAMLFAFAATLVCHWPANPDATPNASENVSILPPPSLDTPLEPASQVGLTLPATIGETYVTQTSTASLDFSGKLQPLLPWIVAFWALGVAMCGLRLLAGWSCLRRWRASGEELVEHSWQVRFDRLREILCVSRPVRLLSSALVPVPMVVGWMKPVILVPTALFAGLPPSQLEAILAHELAHVRRWDYLANLLQNAVETLLFFHPCVWWVSARMRQEREHCCDDAAADACGGAVQFARALAALEELRASKAPFAIAATSGSLLGRVQRLLGVAENRGMWAPWILGIVLVLGAVVILPIALLRAEDEEWNPPRAAHVGSNDFSVYCVHDGRDAAYLLVYAGAFNSSAEHTSSSKSRTWTDSVRLAVKEADIVFSVRRDHTAPANLAITADERGPREYDLGNGRVFILRKDGSVRQLDIPAPIVRDQSAARELQARLALLPPRESLSTGKLQPETVARLKWGEPVNGLRMALAWPPALNDALIGDEATFQLVVQNVSDGEVHFLANADAPNPRRMLWREGEHIVQAFSDEDASPADWRLQPGECSVLRLFTKEALADDGKSISAALGSDLSKLPQYHAIVTMEVANAPDGAWTGKLTTGQSHGFEDVAEPEQKDARVLYKVWRKHARKNGDIPGALIGELATGVRRFIHYNPTWETVPQLEALLPRLDASRDWKSADAIALLDETAAIQTSPLSMALDDELDRVVRTGMSLPEELANATGLWGERDASGLRVAWELYPRRDLKLMTSLTEQVISTGAMGEAVEARLLLHNAGDKPVVLRVPTFLQPGVSASDNEGQPVEVSGTSWTTLSRLVTYRLAPGEYIDISMPGIGFGKDAGREPWAGVRVGWHVRAQPGRWVKLECAPVALDGSESGRREDATFTDGPDWWPAFITARFAREMPLHADPDERARSLERAMADLFGDAPTEQERGDFANVRDETSLAAFTRGLADRPGMVSFFGKLQPTSTWFDIVAADPEAARIPKVVLGPGEYPISAAATLKIVGRREGERIVNDAQILFAAKNVAPHALALSDGRKSFAIVLRPGEGFLYVLERGVARKVDFSNPSQVTDTVVDEVPAKFFDEARRRFNLHVTAPEKQSSIFDKSALPAATPDEHTDDEQSAAPTRKIDWSKFQDVDYSSEIATPLIAADALALAAKPEKSFDDFRSLMFMILQATAEKSKGLRPLLQDEELKRNDDKFQSMALALAAYDYAINGNKQGLTYILDELEKEPLGSDAQAAVPLGFIDEWDETVAAHEKHFARTDGTGGIADSLFWIRRRVLFPEKLHLFQMGRLVAGGLDTASLEGVWEGEKEGASVVMRFGDKVEWEVRRGGTLIKAGLIMDPRSGGGSVYLRPLRDQGDRVISGILKPGDGGTLRVDVSAIHLEKFYPRVDDIVLTRNLEKPSTEPQ
ncbi:MAG: M56 family metallopeptidase [Verrucomicrobiales bacterium]